MRFLRIHPVQSVVDNPTQLSGRGFPRIFHMKLVLSQLYVFGTPKLKPIRVIRKFANSKFEILKFPNFKISKFQGFKIYKNSRYTAPAADMLAAAVACPRHPR